MEEGLKRERLYAVYEQGLPDYILTMASIVHLMRGILEQQLGYAPFVAAERVMGRVKTFASVVQKVQKSAPRFDVSSPQELSRFVVDLVGVRVICDHPPDVQRFVKVVEAKGILAPVGMEISTGYAGLHVLGEWGGVTYEMQVYTLTQQTFATIMRQALYESPELTSKTDLLRELSRLLWQVDRICGELFKEVSLTRDLPAGEARRGRPQAAEKLRLPYDTDPFVPVEQFDLDVSYFGRLLNEVDLAFNRDDALKKGKSLERLVEYLLRCVKCFKVHSDKRTATGQLDFYVAVSKLPGSFLEDWSTYFPVECKNWDKPIGPDVVNKCTSKAHNMGSNLCLIFSRSGITGSPGFDGMGEIRNRFLTQRISVLVISLDDLRKVAAGNNFLSIVEEKWREVRLLA